MVESKKEEKYDKLPSSPDNITEARIFETYVNKDGSEVERPWKDLDVIDATYANNILLKEGNENRKIRFRCAVRDSKNKKKVCNAELYLYTENGRICFKTAEGSFHQHIFANTIHDISDTVVYNPKIFLDKQLVPKKRENKNKPITVYDDIADVPMMPPEIVQPTNLKEFYFQTRKKNMLDFFPNPDGDYPYKYCEGLLNSETVENFRSGLYQFGIPILIIGEVPKEKDLVREYLLTHNAEEGKITIVLRDPFPVSEEEGSSGHLYFVLFADRNPSSDGKKYLVLCDWKGSLSSKCLIPIDDRNRAVKVRVVKGDILKASAQLQLLDDGLFGRLEMLNYFKPSLHPSN